MPKMGLLFVMLRDSFTYLRDQTLFHYHLLPYYYIKALQAALTSVSSRSLLPGMLKCQLPGLQVHSVQNSFPRHQESVNLRGVAPFTQLTVSLSSSSCLHNGLLPCSCLLLILHHGSMLFTELLEKQFETYAREETFQYMKQTPI